MSTQRVSTWGGDYCQNSTDDPIDDGNFYGFTVEEDGTIVSLMSGGKDGEIPSPADDYLAYCNISGKTLNKGRLVTIPLGEVIKNFDLSSGDVTLHRASKP